MTATQKIVQNHVGLGIVHHHEFIAAVRALAPGASWSGETRTPAEGGFHHVINWESDDIPMPTDEAIAQEIARARGVTLEASPE